MGRIAKKAMPKGKRISLTFPRCDTTKEELYKRLKEDPKVERAIVSHEAHEDGGSHLHAYVELKEPCRWAFEDIERCSGKHGHYELVRSRSAWTDYMKKEGEVVGDPELLKTAEDSGKDRRPKISDVVADDIKAGLSMRELVAKYPGFMLMHARQVSYLQYIWCSQPRTVPPKVVWIYGPTGCGKTRLATSLTRPENTWISGKSLLWFDGYHGQEVAVIDDFRKDFCKMHHLLRITDRYPYYAEVKGGHVQWAPKVIVFTADCSPNEMWTKTGNWQVVQGGGYRPLPDQPHRNLGQFLRRINWIVTVPLPLIEEFKTLIGWE